MTDKLWKILDKVNRFGIIISFSGMMISVLIQVFARFLLESAPPWTEELARIFFVFSVAFGAGLAVKEGAYIFLDSILYWFNSRLRSLLFITSKLIVLIIALVMLWYSIEFVAIGKLETSPAMNINMGYVFISISIMAGMISIYSILNLFKKDEEPT